MKKTLLLVPLLLAGCGAAVPLWTRDYASQQTTRTYASAPPAAVAAAAEAVVRQTAAPRDVTVKRTADGVVIDRYYVGYMGLRSVTLDYTFTLHVTPEGKGSRVTLDLAAQRTFNDNGTDYSHDTVYDGGTIPYGDPYRLFFARMDYVLGKRADWVTCAEAPAKLGAQIALDPLCTKVSDGPIPPRG